MNTKLTQPEVANEATTQTLLEIVNRYGTPAYAFDVRRLRIQVEKLRDHLPGSVEILYSLKANASLGICDVFVDCGLGADAASSGELATAVEAGFPANRIFVAGPYKSPETISQLRSLPDAIISIDSPSELETLARMNLPNRSVIRLRPDFGSNAIVDTGSDSRFGVLMDELNQCRQFIGRDGIDVIGFHIFAGSQVLQADGIIEHLRGAFELAMRATEALGIEPKVFNLGGGFGIPYSSDEAELELMPIADELESFAVRAPNTRFVLELGRYLVAQAGWYMTSVVGHQTVQGRHAVVVDGGTHQRADLCGLCLPHKANPPIVLGADTSELVETDVLGCLSLPADVMSEARRLPRMSKGDVLAFANAGAYGLWASPAMFHGSALPAEVAFDGESTQLMREARPASSVLQDQRHVVPANALATPEQ